MIQPETTGRYGSASIILHWLMLLLIMGVYAAIELREFFPRGSEPREPLKMWHFMLGLSVLGLVWLRIAARLLGRVPQSPVAEPAWRRALAKATHLALYVFMIGMPIAGWLILSSEGEAIPFFGGELPALIRRNDGLAEQVEQVHKLGGTIGYWLVGLHAAGALFHHYILRHRTLSRMIPNVRIAQEVSEVAAADVPLAARPTRLLEHHSTGQSSGPQTKPL